jgi:hypothetical protein
MQEKLFIYKSREMIHAQQVQNTKAHWGGGPTQKWVPPNVPCVGPPNVP